MHAAALHEKNQQIVVEGTIQNMHLGLGLDAYHLYDDAPSKIRKYEDIEIDLI